MELPPGFRFQPTDEELITHYLVRKVADSGFRAVAIGEADLNKCEPWDLPQRAKMGEKEWYFFCVRDRKYPTGLRTNRATKAGYWKATGKDSAIYRGRCLVGMKKTLVFYRGRAPKGEKSNWVMHEYRLEGKHCVHNPPSKTTKNEWVVCRVFHKIPTVKKPIKPPGDLTDVNCHSSNVNEAAAATTAAREPAYVTCFSSAPGTFVDQLDEFLLTAPAELRRAAPPVAAEELISAPAPLAPRPAAIFSCSITLSGTADDASETAACSYCSNSRTRRNLKLNFSA